MSEAADKPSGTVSLCDHAEFDRGKWHLLGVGWTQCGAERRQITTFVSIQVPSHPAGVRSFDVRIELWDVEDHAREGAQAEKTRPVAVTGIEGEFEVQAPPKGVWVPPTQVFQHAIPIEAQLRPGRGYLVKMLIGTEPAAWLTFATREDDAEDVAAS